VGESAEWAIVRDDRWIDPRHAAVRLVRTTAHTAFFQGRHEEKRTRLKNVMARGITEAEAKAAADELRSSRELADQEQREAAQRHADRVLAIMEKLKEPRA